MKRRGLVSVVWICTLMLMVGFAILLADENDYTCKNANQTVEITRHNVPAGVNCECTSGETWARIDCSDGFYQEGGVRN